MSRDLGRRVKQLEQASTIDLPWHLPPDDWTDAQLLAAIGEGPDVTDERLAEVIAEHDEGCRRATDENLHPAWGQPPAK